MSSRLYLCSAVSSPAEEFDCAFLWNTSFRAQRRGERGGEERGGEERREALFSLMSLPAQELNAANPYGVQECEDGEILWQREDNISSTIWELGGSQVKTRL